jgi:hypothetical protein
LVPETAAVENRGLKEGILSLMVASVVQPVRTTARTPMTEVTNGLRELIFMGGDFGDLKSLEQLP